MLQGDTNGTVVVPEIVCPLDDEALEELQRTLILWNILSHTVVTCAHDTCN